MIAVTYRLFDLDIDVGKILGDIGGLLFSNQNVGNDTNINEETGQGELGNIFFKISIWRFDLNWFWEFD